MNMIEQAGFVRELSTSIVNQLVADIADGKIPPEWDGIELRQLLADRFNAARMTGTMSGSRKREYLNTILVNNL